MNGEGALREPGLAWCRRLIEYANNRDSDPLVDLLTTGMLRMEARQRLSARACLTEAHELGLFDEPSVNSGSATPTRPTALASGVRNEEETPTIIVGALWDAGRASSNHNGDGQAGRSASDHHSAFSISRQVGVSRTLNDKHIYGLRKGTSEAISDRSNGHPRSSLELPGAPVARSMHASSKRHRSPAVSSPNDSSDKGRVKRRPLETHLTEFRASRTTKIFPPTDDINDIMRADAEHLQMMVDGQVVYMREDNCTINATQILKLSQKTRVQQQAILRTLKKEDKVVFRPARGTYGRQNTWVTIRCGKELCVKHGLVEKLRPLLDHGLDLQLNRSHPDSEKSLVGRKPVLRDSANEPRASPFIEVINRSRPVLVRKSDWRINSTNIANQVTNRSATAKLRQSLHPSSYDIVRGGWQAYQGTYVDFNLGIDWCRKLGLDDLADQLFHLRRTENERAVDVRQDLIASPVFKDLADLPHAVPVSSQSVNFNPVRSPAMAGRSCYKGLSSPDGPVDAGDGQTSTGGFFSEEGRLQIGTNVTQLYARESNDSNNAVSLQEWNDEAQKNDPQYTAGNPSRKPPSYYSYRDLVLRDSQLQEVNLGLQTPSTTSSRYGSALAWPRDLGFDMDETDVLDAEVESI